MFRQNPPVVDRVCGNSHVYQNKRVAKCLLPKTLELEMLKTIHFDAPLRVAKTHPNVYQHKTRTQMSTFAILETCHFENHAF